MRTKSGSSPGPSMNEGDSASMCWLSDCGSLTFFGQLLFEKHYYSHLKESIIICSITGLEKLGCKAILLYRAVWTLLALAAARLTKLHTQSPYCYAR